MFEIYFVQFFFQNYEIIERLGEGRLDTTVSGRGFVRFPADSSYTFEVVVPKTFDYNVVVRYEVRDKRC